MVDFLQKWPFQPLISMKCKYMKLELRPMAQDPQAMLTEIYIEALLVDEELADQVWEAWDQGEIDDQVACIAWWLIAGSRFTPNSGR
jgi:hypothetical protein